MYLIVSIIKSPTFSKSSEGATDLGKKGCHVLEVDVTEQEMIDAALEKVKDQLKEKKLSLHGIVNNAGEVMSLNSEKNGTNPTAQQNARLRRPMSK